MSVSQILKRDHAEVKKLFKEFEKAEEDRQFEIARTCMQMLTAHTAMEEEMVYPVMREMGMEPDMVNEAMEEHHVAKNLIREMSDLDWEDEAFKAKFMVLMEAVEHHVQEEEKEMLPKFEKEGDKQQLKELTKALEERHDEFKSMAEQSMGGGSRRSRR